jgi:preprotein translocase subunit SecG
VCWLRFFFITSLGLTYLSSHKTEAGGVMDKAVPVQSVKPAEEAPVKSVDEGAPSKATEIPE